MEDTQSRSMGAAEGASAAELNALLAGDARLQSQFDRLVGKALQTARGNWEREKDEQSREDGLARESEYRRELEKREQAIRRRELRADAAAMLGARGLPPELLDCVDASRADALEGSVNKLEHAFRASVESALKTRLAGAPPRGGEGEARADSKLRRAMGLKTE